MNASTHKTTAKPAVKAKPSPQPLYHLGRSIDCEASLAQAVAALRLADPHAIPAMLERTGPPPLRRGTPGFAGLVSIIISQQVSVASADAIFARVRAALVPLTSQRLLQADDASLRACGLSGPKMRALRSLAQAVADGGLAIENLADMPAADAHAALVSVKGIGPWTADIFLLFCLGHPDAWPAGDLALQEAARLALQLDLRPDTRALEAIGERWRPHRGVAARILWAYYGVAKGGSAGVVTV